MVQYPYQQQCYLAHLCTALVAPWALDNTIIEEDILSSYMFTVLLMPISTVPKFQYYLVHAYFIGHKLVVYI